MRPPVYAGVTLVLAALLATAVARADDDASSPAAAPPSEPSPWLFGDWNGERTRLKERGIDFQFGYTGEAAYNATGGTRRDAAYADQYTAGVTLDLESSSASRQPSSRRRSPSAPAAISATTPNLGRCNRFRRSTAEARLRG